MFVLSAVGHFSTQESEFASKNVFAGHSDTHLRVEGSRIVETGQSVKHYFVVS